MSAHKVRMAGIAAALGAVAALGATTFASGPAITDAGSANTKTAGITLPDKLSPQWRETTVAQGSTALENPSALTSWYGYYNDGPMVPAPGDVQAHGPQRRGDQERAGQEHLPRRQGPARRRPEVRLRHALPLPGPRARHVRGRLHHAHQPRRRCGAPRDEARRDRGRRQDAGARDRRLDLGSVRAAPALHHRGRRLRRRRRGDARLPRPRSRSSGACSARAASRASRTTSSATSTSSRTRAAPPARSTRTPSSRTASSTGCCRTTRRTWTRAASCRCCRSRRSSTPGRSSSAATPTPTSCPPTRKDLHTYGHVFKTLWVTIHDTKKDGTAAFDANAAAKKAGGTPFKRPENGVFKPGTGFKKFFFTETGDTTLTTEAGTLVRRLRRDPGAVAGPEERQGHAAALLPVGQDALELRQHHVLRQVAR